MQTPMKLKTHVMDERRGVVYEVPCKECRKTYVGEVKRTLRVRLTRPSMRLIGIDPEQK